MKKASFKNSIDKRIYAKIMAAGRNSARLFWKEVNKNTYTPDISEVKKDEMIITEENDILREIERHFKELNKIPESWKDSETDLSIIWEDGTVNREHNYAVQIPNQCSITREHSYSMQGNDVKPDWDSMASRKMSKSELMMSIRKLKYGKSAGVDDIPNEFLKFGGHGLWGCLVSLMNRVRHEEKVPSLWNKGYISLIHKGGAHNELDNYRGITVSSNMGKLFTSVIYDLINRRK